MEMKTLVTSALLVAALSIAGVRAQQSPAAPPAAPTAADFQRSLAQNVEITCTTRSW
jgi:hypothetical protein